MPKASSAPASFSPPRDTKRGRRARGRSRQRVDEVARAQVAPRPIADADAYPPREQQWPGRGCARAPGRARRGAGRGGAGPLVLRPVGPRWAPSGDVGRPLSARSRAAGAAWGSDARGRRWPPRPGPRCRLRRGRSRRRRSTTEPWSTNWPLGHADAQDAGRGGQGVRQRAPRPAPRARPSRSRRAGRSPRASRRGACPRRCAEDELARRAAGRSARR